MSMKKIIEFLQTPIRLDRIILKMLGKKVVEEDVESQEEVTQVDATVNEKAVVSEEKEQNKTETVSQVEEEAEEESSEVEKVEEDNETESELEDESSISEEGGDSGFRETEVATSVPEKTLKPIVQESDNIEINLNKTLTHSHTFEEIEKEIYKNSQQFQQQFKENYKETEYKFLRKKKGSHIIIKKPNTE